MSEGRALARFAALPLLLGFAACSSVGAIVGAAAGAGTGAVTTNPVVGYAVAIGVKAGVDALQHYVARVRQNAEQDAIVEAVGQMQIDEVRPWKIVHDIPEFDDEHGQMQVVRLIETPLTQCKEVLFTVDEKRRRTLYTTAACLDTQGWKWATAEPATERWGYFQKIHS